MPYADARFRRRIQEERANGRESLPAAAAAVIVRSVYWRIKIRKDRLRARRPLKDRLRAPRPLRPLDPDGPLEATAIDERWLAELPASSRFEQLRQVFANYPPRSMMSDESRTSLFCLIRALKPAVAVEIGTHYAGTTEVMARAVWENGHGVVHTVDPYGRRDRAPAVMAAWPEPLRGVVEFYELSSMDYFTRQVQSSAVLDLVLVDGNHDFEYALFDLQMAVRLLRPGGIVVMDNVEQTGPYFAARELVARSPGWADLGGALAAFEPLQPFAHRPSIPETSFLVLRAPDAYAIDGRPRSWGQRTSESPRLRGFSLEMPPQRTQGALHYQVIFRAFFDQDRDVEEHKEVAVVDLDVGEADRRVAVTLERILESSRELRAREYTTEIELAWGPAPGAAPLLLSCPPEPLD